MKISELFEHKKRTFSFEFFPPKTKTAEKELVKTIEELKFLNPDFVSVTYGAGGSTRKRTIDLVARLKRYEGLNVMAHLACIGHTAGELEGIARRLLESGVENILALRGDTPKDKTGFRQPPDGLKHANELVTLLRKTGDFCIGVAGHPEGHPESLSREYDIENLKRKVDAGASFIITQLFFDSHHYLDFVERCRAARIEVRIIPGILPITNLKQVKFITQLCGAHFPPGLSSRLEKYADDSAAVAHIGLEHALRQCSWLLDDGAPGIHFYTLNHSRATHYLVDLLRY